MHPDTSVGAVNEVTIMTDSLMDIMYDSDTLIQAFENCKKGSIWKESVQRYESNLLKQVNHAQKELIAGTYKQKPFNEFLLHERGKSREVKAIHISDRVVLRAFCDRILFPTVNKYLIYDNGASVKDKGIQFTRDRFVTHLRKYYRTYQNNLGYVLLIDFSKYFDNIQHEKLLEEYKKRIKDEEVINFLEKLIKFSKVDVSYLSDREYNYCMYTIFNAIEYSKVDKSLLTGEKFMEKSIGIGSQISQISGLLYPARIDNYCKIVKGLKFYGRYMDDIYIIHEDKNYLKQLLLEIHAICLEYGIFINIKKTQIIKISSTFTFLKTRYSLTESGKVIQRLSRDSITRERRKLKKYKELVDCGKMSYKDVENAYKSWRGNVKKYASYHVLKNMDLLYNDLFITPFIRQGGKTC